MNDTKGNEQSQAKLREAWGHFVSGLAPWDWYVTLTYRDPKAEDKRRGWTKVGTHYAARSFKAFIKAVEKKAEQEVRWCCGLEYQRWRGVPHYHALIADVPYVRRMYFVDWWWSRYGIARILPYDASRGASYYLSKYVTKDLGEVYFSEHLTNEAICDTIVTRGERCLL